MLNYAPIGDHPENPLSPQGPMRTRSKWHKHRRQASLDDNATALAYICWQVALDKTKNLHQQDFVYDSDEQRTAVIAEYLVFLVHVCDRLVYRDLDQQQRQSFVETLARQTARHYQRNLEDVFGRGEDYTGRYIDTLNARIGEYSECSFDQDRPGYQMVRTLGSRVQDVMGDGQVNRWVIDQIMEIDAPDAVMEIRKALDNLFGSARLLEGLAAPE